MRASSYPLALYLALHAESRYNYQARWLVFLSSEMMSSFLDELSKIAEVTALPAGLTPHVSGFPYGGRGVVPSGDYAAKIVGATRPRNISVHPSWLGAPSTASGPAHSFFADALKRIQGARG